MTTYGRHYQLSRPARRPPRPTFAKRHVRVSADDTDAMTVAMRAKGGGLDQHNSNGIEPSRVFDGQ